MAVSPPRAAPLVAVLARGIEGRMTMSDNPSAFPVSDIGVHGQFGMTLRDYFAGQALPTIIAVCAGDTSITARPSTEAYFAEKAYLLADAMLAARTGDA